MSKLDIKNYSPAFFKGLNHNATGGIKVEVDGTKANFPVTRAEVRAETIVLNFDMSGGDPDRNEFIGLVIDKGALNERIELPNEAVYLLFQNRTQEWVAEKGWIRVDWKEGSKTVMGLMDNIRSGREGNSVLTAGRIDVAIG